MKKWIAVLAVMAILTGCRTMPEVTDVPESMSEPASSASMIQEDSPVEDEAESQAASSASALPSSDADASAEKEMRSEDSPAATEIPATEPKPAAATKPKPTTEPTPQPTVTPTPEPTAEPTPAPTAQPTAAPTPKPAALAYGAVPFNLAAGTEEWWGIDSTDSAYQACADNINAIRAEQGLPALALNSDLSAAADARCESFVAGAPFDHSGMTTLSEICARGPLRSAQEVCTAWKGSTAHYNNIMRTDISQMGVGCWFCSTSQGDYTYWVVTFG